MGKRSSFAGDEAVLREEQNSAQQLIDSPSPLKQFLFAATQEDFLLFHIRKHFWNASFDIPCERVKYASGPPATARNATLSWKFMWMGIEATWSQPAE
jgi:hypothetical protein